MAAILVYQQSESKHKTGGIKVKKMLSVSLQTAWPHQL